MKLVLARDSVRDPASNMNNKLYYIPIQTVLKLDKAKDRLPNIDTNIARQVIIYLNR